MTDVADRYISKSGRTDSYDRDGIIDDLITVSSFLIWAEDEYFAGVTGKEAFAALCRMSNFDPIALRKAIKI